MGALLAITSVLTVVAPPVISGSLLPRAAALPPVVQGTTPVVNATLTYPWPIVRDGGGGGKINGKHIINFSDSQTLNENDYKNNGFYPFVSNTITSSSGDGKTLTDYGSNYAIEQWKLTANETAPSNYRTAIWPNTNIVSGCNGQCGYTVSNVINITFSPYATQDLYSTLANITMTANGPSVTRAASQLWFPNEINYGLFSLARARDGTGDIFLFAAPSGAFGIKVARVAEASIADRKKYKFWNGSAWVTTAPAPTDSASNILSYNAGGWGPGTGDIFWSPYFNTWLAVFFDGFSPDGTFRLLYSKKGNIVGPWSSSQDIYVTAGCPSTNGNCGVGYNYATHAYPDIDTTGKTLLLGWTYNGAITQFTTVTFQ